MTSNRVGDAAVANIAMTLCNVNSTRQN